jgi:hypothetical protein
MAEVSKLPDAINFLEVSMSARIDDTELMAFFIFSYIVVAVIKWLWSPLNLRNTLHLVRRAENVSLGVDDPLIWGYRLAQWIRQDRYSYFSHKVFYRWSGKLL